MSTDDLSGSSRPSSPVGLEDRLDLHELAARYGDLIDARDWAGLAEVFTEDAVFDLTDTGGPRLTGLDAIRAFMNTARHPHTHLITNVQVVPGDPMELRSRVIGILDDRRVGSGWYRDDVVRTPNGWRVRTRRFRMLRVPRRQERPDCPDVS